MSSGEGRLPGRGAPDAALRAHLDEGGRVRVHARRFTLEAEGRASWDESAAHPSALDYLLTALAADLMAGLEREARRDGTPVHTAELRLQAWIENPLVVAGVVGESGSPRLRAIRGSLFLGSPAGEESVAALWDRIRARAPVLASLAPEIEIAIEVRSLL